MRTPQITEPGTTDAHVLQHVPQILLDLCWEQEGDVTHEGSEFRQFTGYQDNQRLIQVSLSKLAN